MEDLIFTKIIKGEVPSHRIYEDETTYAFLDVHPAIEGYTLVIPKRQVDHIWDLPDDEYVALMRSVKKVAEKQRATLGKARVGVKIEGLEVPHAHVKVFAFSTAEEFNAPAHDSDDEALAAVAERLRIDD